MKSFIKFGNLTSNTIQRIIIFLGMLLVFLFVVYFVRKYSITEGLTTDAQPGVINEYISPPPPPPPPPQVDSVITNASGANVGYIPPPPPPPPPTVASPPSTVASPPPTVASPPPTVASPPPTVASPPPTVASPPPSYSQTSGYTVQVVQVVS